LIWSEFFTLCNFRISEGAYLGPIRYNYLPL
jgi:hypothetical protein